MREYPSLVGKRFGRLVVVRQEESSADGRRRWLCRCDCGNTCIATTAGLNQGKTTNCGCGRSPDLSGQTFGKLVVLGRSERRGSRGGRTTPLWECRCQCGAIVYKPTDALKNASQSMCAACAGQSNVQKARQGAGYVQGTQLSRLRDMTPGETNSSGCRGVYYDPRSRKYRARLKFKGKTMNFGSYSTFEEAVAARKEAEKEYFEAFLREHG